MQCYYVMVYKYKNMKTFFYVFANLTNQNMPVVILSIAAVAIGGTAYYMRKRLKLKDGDKDIAKERQRKKKIELLKGGSSLPTVVAQILHPEHELFLDFGQTYRCDACLQYGEGKRYRCRGLCGFRVHPNCALS
ncbi:probable nucleoredoxin 1 isoform X3 [Amaranthus tricolor]|uniref:probable nucleoredoxin 1 isoform X3 n=1 Tax=Amaranthus tricolor TaxID=29722 RepID=UPI00258ADBF9|nr:probable nucleoredoxin 1 isoform X3 [Amaranthus tricolor]